MLRYPWPYIFNSWTRETPGVGWNPTSTSEADWRRGLKKSDRVYTRGMPWAEARIYEVLKPPQSATTLSSSRTLGRVREGIYGDQESPPLLVTTRAPGTPTTSSPFRSSGKRHTPGWLPLCITAATLYADGFYVPAAPSVTRHSICIHSQGGPDGIFTGFGTGTVACKPAKVSELQITPPSRAPPPASLAPYTVLPLDFARAYPQVLDVSFALLFDVEVSYSKHYLHAYNPLANFPCLAWCIGE